MSSLASRCPEPDAARNPRPQAPHYRGPCLEGAARFERDPQAPETFTGYDREGKRVVTLKVTDTGLQHTASGGRQLKLFDVTTLDGQRNFCDGETYDATDEELQEQCQNGGDNCPYFAEMKNKAVLIPGYWSGATWHSSETSYTLSCVSGVLAKCIHWGYVPGANYKDDPTKPLEPYFQACVQAARARYLTDANQDHSYTCAGTRIDIYDNLGIQRKTVQGFSFESLWSKEGLVCMKRPRYRNCGTLRASPGCEDPVAGVNQEWTGSEGLIAISSAESNDIGVCPNTVQDCKAPTR